jgi:AcrR family transcriptional regulator
MPTRKVAIDRFLPNDFSQNGLRARNKLATRARILAAAQSRFGTKGFEATTMAEIARAAHVSTPTVFNYFPNKQLLLIELHREDRRQQAIVAREILERPTVSPVDLVCALLRTNVNPLDGRKDRKLWREIIAATIRLNTKPDDEFAHSHQVFERFLAEALCRCKDSGSLRQDFDVATAVRTIFAINRNNLRKLLSTPGMSIGECVALSREQVAQLLEPWVRAGRSSRANAQRNGSGSSTKATGRETMS